MENVNFFPKFTGFYLQATPSVPTSNPFSAVEQSYSRCCLIVR
ncbi:hypothetical protein HMPREF0298_0053 [Corynebacterium lipophiloflavum DSM 44291]|uniref:Uncharacterized protein n=1 Tax=Corynebacterium lipophiloflavum (strain ATCC 700352 / DSM 44291 / CCUG 37336 / JCM 10383 / DMMZ 1944) TaxID=525263 RepID=C0XNN3_CORLD|nr:hypothetical protein HMPREF0298_0053 [Corynebacterium lipophiloflavum DSM 44291]